MSDLKYVAVDGAPEAIGPYSQAVGHGDTLYCSGALALDPSTGSLVGGTIGEEAAQCLNNLEAVCRGADTSLDRALQLTVYTTQLELFAEINEAYASFFAGKGLPARVTIGVAALPLGARVEISALVAT